MNSMLRILRSNSRSIRQLANDNLKGLRDSARFSTLSAMKDDVVNGLPVKVFNQGGKFRVVSTKDLPGDRWLEILKSHDCRVEICTAPFTILNNLQIKGLIGSQCDGVIGQLTEDWSDELFSALAQAGGKVYSNYAVGYNNVNVPDATKLGIAVGNTPGVLTETTAEMGLSLTFAAARRIVEGDSFMRAELYKGWLPDLFIGNLLQGKTVGIIGAGRIGTAYARMMSEGHKMNVVYYDPYPASFLENYIQSYGDFLASQGEPRVSCARKDTIAQVLQEADVVSLHCVLDKSTHHLISTKELDMMKANATLVNVGRGPLIDEVALVEHLRKNPEFRVGLDVFEDEPLMKPGLKDMPNAVIVPHIASASFWTRAAMASLAASNVATQLAGLPAASSLGDVGYYVDDDKPAPQKSPSIVNAESLSIKVE